MLHTACVNENKVDLNRDLVINYLNEKELSFDEKSLEEHPQECLVITATYLIYFLQSEIDWESSTDEIIIRNIREFQNCSYAFGKLQNIAPQRIEGLEKELVFVYEQLDKKYKKQQLRQNDIVQASSGFINNMYADGGFSPDTYDKTTNKIFGNNKTMIDQKYSAEKLAIIQSTFQEFFKKGLG